MKSKANIKDEVLCGEREREIVTQTEIQRDKII